MGYVYEISDSAHTYVGKTTHRWPRCRLSEHRRVARKGRQTPFYRWLQTDPELEFSVLCKAEGEALDDYERQFIAHRRAGPKKCLNLNDGGEGGWSHLTPEQHKKRAKRSAAAKRGTKHSEKTKRKMRASHAEKGSFYTEVHTGRLHTSETKRKIRNRLTGIKRSEETKARMREAQRRRRERERNGNH